LVAVGTTICDGSINGLTPMVLAKQGFKTRRLHVRSTRRSRRKQISNEPACMAGKGHHAGRRTTARKQTRTYVCVCGSVWSLTATATCIEIVHPVRIRPASCELRRLARLIMSYQLHYFHCWSGRNDIIVSITGKQPMFTTVHELARCVDPCSRVSLPPCI
jgi:hypothetical protein